MNIEGIYLHSFHNNIPHSIFSMLENKQQAQKNLRVLHSTHSSSSDIVDSVRLEVYDNWVTLRLEIKL